MEKHKAPGGQLLKLRFSRVRSKSSLLKTFPWLLPHPA